MPKLRLHGAQHPSIPDPFLSLLSDEAWQGRDHETRCQIAQIFFDYLFLTDCNTVTYQQYLPHIGSIKRQNWNIFEFMKNNELIDCKKKKSIILSGISTEADFGMKYLHSLISGRDRHKLIINNIITFLYKLNCHNASYIFWGENVGLL